MAMQEAVDIDGKNNAMFGQGLRGGRGQPVKRQAQRPGSLHRCVKAIRCPVLTAHGST